jgi:hypothetical protein
MISRPGDPNRCNGDGRPHRHDYNPGNDSAHDPTLQAVPPFGNGPSGYDRPASPNETKRV